MNNKKIKRKNKEHEKGDYELKKKDYNLFYFCHKNEIIKPKNIKTFLIIEFLNLYFYQLLFLFP